MKRLALLAIVLSACATASPTPATVSRIVSVDGGTYRVEVSGRTVRVYDKAFVAKRSPEAGERMRTAVRQATGCDIAHDYWAASHIEGLLDCASSPSPARQ